MKPTLAALAGLSLAATFTAGRPAVVPAAAVSPPLVDTGWRPPAPEPVVVAKPAPVVAKPAPVAKTGQHGTPYFRTPQAAMRYLVRAYNRHDAHALAQVTSIDGRNTLKSMRTEAPALTLLTCTPKGTGSYTCHFRHTYPASLHRTGYGHADFTVAPAIRHGWYMTVVESCG